MLSANNTDRRALSIEWDVPLRTKYRIQWALGVLALSAGCVRELSVDYPQKVCRTVPGLYFPHRRDVLQK